MPTDRVGRRPEQTPDELDRRMMLRAISLARRGLGRVEPNPMVGCVVVQRGRIIGEGYHHRFGAPHAEVEALSECAGSPRRATVYVSLEPCCHQGKTPPCCDALIRAGVARVVIAVRDPSPHVGGGGIRALGRAGVKVRTGVCEHEAAEVLAPFLTRICAGRPYVIAKWAQSLDGKLATRSGDSKWISSEASRRLVHRLRARVDAVLVGSGTVGTDDPLLTARDVPLRRRAMRVILDGRLRTPTTCRLVATCREIPTLILTSLARAQSSKARRLVRQGVAVIACRSRAGRLSLPDCLRKLASRDVTNLLVEGGPTVLASFLGAGLVDEAHVFVAPILIGGKGFAGPFDGPGVPRVADAITAKQMTTRRCGPDMLYSLRLTDPPFIAGSWWGGVSKSRRDD